MRAGGQETSIREEIKLDLPPFWNTDAPGWFQQVEEQFRLNQIVHGMTRFNLVWPRLPREVMRLCHPIYLNRNTQSEPYDVLKAEVLRVTNIVEDNENIQNAGRASIKRHKRNSSLLRTGLQRTFFQ